MKKDFELSYNKLLKMISQSITWEMLNVTIRYFKLWSSMEYSDESKIDSIKKLIESKKLELIGSKRTQHV